MIIRLAVLTEKISRFICLIGLAGLIGLAFATVADVLMRFLFNSPIVGVRDTASLFVAVAISCAFPICLVERRHITIKFLSKILGTKGNANLEIFGHLITLIIFALMAWRLWLYTDQLVLENETTKVLGWPIAPWWRGMTIIIAYCVPVQLVVFLQSVQTSIFLKRGPSEVDPEGTSGN
jgi:TRAP-type transport system small permease protein